jgi:RNA polymerase-binding transcription factor DksA
MSGSARETPGRFPYLSNFTSRNRKIIQRADLAHQPQERNMSEADRAQEVEALDWAHNNRPRKPLPVFAPHDKGYGPAECVECGDSMPALRREMGCSMCTECTDFMEQRQKQGAA